MRDAADKPMTLAEATKPVADAPSAEVQAWQDAKVRAALKAADAGDFASPDEVRKVVRKYVPHG